MNQIPEAPKTTDPKMALVLLVKEHLNSVHVKKIAQFMISDQFAELWTAPFSSSRGRFDNTGGLMEAMLVGYRALRVLIRTAEALFTKVDEDRLVAIYMTMMISRWCNIRTMQRTFERANPASATSVAVANAIGFGLDLTPVEVQAMTLWYESRSEMLRIHEGFSPEWWVLSETMNWLFVGNRR